MKIQVFKKEEPEELYFKLVNKSSKKINLYVLNKKGEILGTLLQLSAEDIDDIPQHKVRLYLPNKLKIKGLNLDNYGRMKTDSLAI
jgi:hypothetical protein